MRWLSSAIWTSGEPVSPSVVAYSAMIFFLVSASVPIDMRGSFRFSLRGAPGPVHRGTLDPRPSDGVSPSWATGRAYQRAARLARSTPNAAGARRVRRGLRHVAASGSDGRRGRRVGLGACAASTPGGPAASVVVAVVVCCRLVFCWISVSTSHSTPARTRIHPRVVTSSGPTCCWLNASARISPTTIRPIGPSETHDVLRSVGGCCPATQRPGPARVWRAPGAAASACRGTVRRPGRSRTGERACSASDIARHVPHARTERASTRMTKRSASATSARRSAASS